MNIEFECEKDYHAARLIAQSLLDAGLLTPKEYQTLDEMLLKKYCPLIAGFFRK